MADYYPLLTRVLDGLSDQSLPTRHAVYDLAYKNLMDHLRILDPPLSETDITRERRAFQEAVNRVEAERSRIDPRPEPVMEAPRTERPCAVPQGYISVRVAMIAAYLAHAWGDVKWPPGWTMQFPLFSWNRLDLSFGVSNGFVTHKIEMVHAHGSTKCSPDQFAAFDGLLRLREHLMDGYLKAYLATRDGNLLENPTVFWTTKLIDFVHLNGSVADLAVHMRPDPAPRPSAAARCAYSLNYFPRECRAVTRCRTRISTES